ncbi:Cysteine desulfurase, partial [hydrothermal vent metagenome]
ASMAPLPAQARDAMTTLLLEQSESIYLNMNRWLANIAQTRKLAAKITGAKAEEIAFIRNTSDGVSIVASGIRWKKGDEIIINDLEFPSNVYPWLNLERLGVKIVKVESKDGIVSPSMLIKHVTPKTKLLAISSVQFSTGYRVDLATLGQMARDQDFLFFVDAIQSLGVLPMDVKEFGIDFLSCGGHKWLCAPEGIGIFFCDESRLDLLDLTRLGWNSVENNLNFSNIDFTIKKTAGRFEEGTTNLVGLYGLQASLELLLEKGIERNEEHVLNLNEHLRHRLAGMGYKILSPQDEKRRSGIVIFSTADPSQNEMLVKKLANEKVLVIERGGGVRVSPHFFNTMEDIDRLLSLL